MTYTFRPAVREHTPLIIGIAGPTKSGKTYSAHRVAIGLANGGTIAMINAEGAKGHQYAEKFKYVACDIVPPYRPMAYTDALDAAARLNPAVVIIDSGSHMHDGPGGILEWHEEELDVLAKNRPNDRNKFNFAAWVKPKAAENEFIYAMLGMKCHVVLCFRAKEKIKIVPGRDPVDLGWQPIAGERVAFETIFTLMLPPHSKGVPDLEISDMREPFDTLVPKGKPLDEQLGKKLAEWAAGAKAVAPKPATTPTPSPTTASNPTTTPPVTTATTSEPANPTGAPFSARTPDEVASTERALFGDTDAEQERAALVAEIYKIRDGLDRVPNATVWKILCEHKVKTIALETVDPAALTDFRDWMTKLAAKDKTVVDEANAAYTAATTERKSA